jgi:nitroimidazol reductase NimA-like FMN-containing flavoprotein (pyridoxamine 5'-phosphate oxidase superfamily)
MMSEFPITERNRIRQLPKRGQYDKDTIYRIIDEALVCHVGFVEDNQPFVIPMLHARLDDTLILHGARASRMLRHIQAGEPICVAITLLDGLVLARSVFHHSINYRSVVLFGTGRVIDGEDEKLRALQVLTEHIVPGRWAEARKPNPQELNATAVVSISIESASAKIRTGPPSDDEEDYPLPVWAGVLPIRQQAQKPVNDPILGSDIPVPGYVLNYDRVRKLA